jgi:hypothetical protein
METCPALATLINVMLQTLENGLVKGTAELAFCRIGVL